MKPFTTFAVILLAAISVLQLLRAALQWSVVINGWSAPPWISVVAGIVAGTTAVMLWRESRSRPSPP